MVRVRSDNATDASPETRREGVEAAARAVGDVGGRDCPRRTIAEKRRDVSRPSRTHKTAINRERRFAVETPLYTGRGGPRDKTGHKRRIRYWRRSGQERKRQSRTWMSVFSAKTRQISCPQPLAVHAGPRRVWLLSTLRTHTCARGATQTRFTVANAEGAWAPRAGPGQSE